LFFISTVKAQDSIPKLIPIETDKLLIPKLDILVEEAWKKHGMVKFREAEIDAKKANLKSNARYWTRNFGFQADYRYGTFANFSENISETAQINLATNTTQVNYGVGFYVRLPVFDLYNRGNEIKQAEAEIVQAESFLEFQKFEVKERVIMLYEDLKLKQNVLDISAKNLSNARLSSRMAEIEYKKGIITIHEFVRLTDITARIELEYERRRSEFLTSKKLLENFTGLVFN